MTRSALLILPAALLCLAATPAQKAPAATVTNGGAFDAQNPQSLMTIVGKAGAAVQTKARDQDSVFVAVTSTAANFSMQFAGCTPQGRECRAVLLDAAMDRAAVTGGQINAFNQTSVMCRIYQDRAGAPHVLYSAILFRTMSRTDAETHLQAWQEIGRAHV